MFTDSMLEVTWAQRSRRNWTTLTSFGLQGMVISLLLVLPLWKTVGLPGVRMVSTPVSLGWPSSEPVQRPQTTAGAPAAPSNPAGIRFVQPGRFPAIPWEGADATEPQPFSGPASGPGPVGLPIGVANGFPLPIIARPQPVMPAPPPATAHAYRTSSMLEGSLIRRVVPVYPYPAKMAHVEGPVVLAATISKAGTIEDLHVISGHPLLVGAAVEAVQLWRYRPYILNHEPIEVETQITVTFTLSGS
jgi:protein TonB